MRGTTALSVAVAGLVLLTAGCSADDTEASGDAPAGVDAGDDTLPRLLVDPSPLEEDDAEMRGTLAYDESTRCFRLDDDGYSTAVVWPTGTELADGEPVGVVVPGVGDVRVGDRVQGGGGFRSIDSQSEVPRDVAECVGSDAEYAVLGRVSQVDDA